MTTRRSVSTDLLLVAVATLLFGIQIVRLLQLDDSCGAYRMAAFEGMQNGD